jgi:murein DD-endopeptidase MepM/ murein hydrolase activator NlpD
MRVRAALSRTVFLVAVLVAALPAAQAGAAELGERTLERGDRGDDVRALQDLLTQLGLDTDADGVFGSGTVTSVERYERREDLPVDGRASPGQVHGMQRRAGQAAPNQVPSDDPAGADTTPPGTPGGTTPGDGTASGTFPVDGAHHYGGGFGGGHQGQDVMADCGTPLRAVKAVTVRRVATQAAAGRYIVLHDGDSGEDYVYMHMSAVDVATGDSVGAGEKVGEVGQTGDATACHLHFEEWTAPGWYAGGHAKDPMPFLRSLGGS